MQTWEHCHWVINDPQHSSFGGIAAVDTLYAYEQSYFNIPLIYSSMITPVGSTAFDICVL